MKAYTDLEQSKKLAEILAIESADMHYATWTILNDEFIVSPNQGSTIKSLQEDYGNQIIPCWSIAALLDVINTNYYTTLYHDGVAWNIDIIHHDNDKEKHNAYANTPIDACVKMIIELHEQKLL